MSEHTPKPWEFHRGGGHAYDSIRGSDHVQTQGRPNVTANASYSVVVCGNFGNMELSAPRANVRLMIAAPETLEALKDLVGFLEAHVDSIGEEYGPHERISDAKEVIAKAEGERT